MLGFNNGFHPSKNPSSRVFTFPFLGRGLSLRWSVGNIVKSLALVISSRSSKQKVVKYIDSQKSYPDSSSLSLFRHSFFKTHLSLRIRSLSACTLSSQTHFRNPMETHRLTSDKDNCLQGRLNTNENHVSINFLKDGTSYGFKSLQRHIYFHLKDIIKSKLAL